MKRIAAIWKRSSDSGAHNKGSESGFVPSVAIGEEEDQRSSHSVALSKSVRQSSSRRQATQRTLVAGASQAQEEDDEDANAAEAAWRTENSRNDFFQAEKRRLQALQEPSDPDIPEWCMRDVKLPGEGDDAHPQPNGCSQHHDSNAPRDTEPECAICQEEKTGRWTALPCAHTFHDMCVKKWLQQNPSCPVCRMTFPTLQAGHAGPNSRAEAWLGSTAVTVSDGKRSAMHQFEQMMDPNVLARVVVPRPLNNFLDNLPSEERLASDGPWTLFEPAKKFIIETKDDISEKVQRLCLGAPAGADVRHTRLLEDAPPPHARGGPLVAQVLDMGQETIEWTAGAAASAGAGAAAAGGGAAEGGKKKLALANGAAAAAAHSSKSDVLSLRGKQGMRRSQPQPATAPATAPVGSSTSACPITRNAAHLRNTPHTPADTSHTHAHTSAAKHRNTASNGASCSSCTSSQPADLAPALLQAKARTAVASSKAGTASSKGDTSSSKESSARARITRPQTECLV